MLACCSFCLQLTPFAPVTINGGDTSYFHQVGSRVGTTWRTAANSGSNQAHTYGMRAKLSRGSPPPFRLVVNRQSQTTFVGVVYRFLSRGAGPYDHTIM